MRYKQFSFSVKLIALFLFTMSFGCGKSGSGGEITQPPLSTTETIKYVADATDFPNPERGFYRVSETNAAAFKPLTLSLLQGYRNEQSIFTANYKVLSTLVFRYYILTGFNDTPLSPTLLNNIKADFDIARQAGVKLVPRFTYTVTTRSGACPEGSICPPYGDASKAVVLNHISQLNQFLQITQM